MKKWSFVLILLLSLMSPCDIAAQEVPTIDNLEIDLWPEYDKHEMLVIYRIELSTEVSPPVELSFRIPVEAGDPHAVAVRDPDSGLLTAPYERIVDGDWAVITLIATMPGIQIEYYDPQIQIEGTHREFQFTWQGDYEVKSLSIKLQQPFDASQVKTNPIQTRIIPGSDGLSYHTIELGAMPAGESASISLEYIKASDALTVDDLSIMPVSPISSSISGRMSFMDYIPWGLGTLGVLLFTGGIYWYWRLGRQQPKLETKRSRRHSTREKSQSSVTDDEAVYCYNCGKRAAPGDRFCRSCGTKLRRN